jgi:H+/Cl- antiporter ClcA
MGNEITGAAGRVFGPAFSSGATIGSVVSSWLELSRPNSNIVMVLGMVAFLTGITRPLFTSAIHVLEMTDGHQVEYPSVYPLMNYH